MGSPYFLDLDPHFVINICFIFLFTSFPNKCIYGSDPDQFIAISFSMINYKDFRNIKKIKRRWEGIRIKGCLGSCQLSAWACHVLIPQPMAFPFPIGSWSYYQHTYHVVSDTINDFALFNFHIFSVDDMQSFVIFSWRLFFVIFSLRLLFLKICALVELYVKTTVFLL